MLLFTSGGGDAPDRTRRQPHPLVGEPDLGAAVAEELGVPAHAPAGAQS
jgi:hypothetical protein